MTRGRRRRIGEEQALIDRIFGTAAALALAFQPAAGWAQAARAAPQPQAAAARVAAHPALWVVKDDDTTIYLFGTVHVLKPSLSWFDGAVKKAFERSDTLVLEMVEPDAATMQQSVASRGLDLGGTPLSQKLPEAKRSAYAATLGALGIPPAGLDVFRPWMAAVTLSVAGLPKLGYDPNSGAEKVLAAAAKASGKPVEGLETFDQQLGYLADMAEPLQIKYLVSVIDDYPKMGSELDKMVARWAAGDPEGLAKVMNESLDETPELAKVLLTDRNARWTDWIVHRLDQPGTVFVAVGAAHLAGQDSVVSMLAKRRYPAVRVAN